MKIALISDLHLDRYARTRGISLEKATTDLSQALAPIDFEVLVIAGDLSNDCRLTQKIAQTLEQQLARPLFYVPGNHDLFNMENKWSTKAIVQSFKEDERCLWGERVELADGATLVGHCGWYDYSYGSKDYSVEQYASGRLGHGYWNDRDYIDFGMSDPDYCAQVQAKLEELLAPTVDDPEAAKRTLLVTHMINHPKFLVHPPKPSLWDFFNGFLGSKTLYQYLAKHPIKAAVCGHIHYRFHFVLEGMAYYCQCLGRIDEWPKISQDLPLTLEAQVKDATKVIEL